jgi:hypothetical protein
MSPLSQITTATNNYAGSFESYGLTLSQVLLLGHRLVDSGKFDAEGRRYLHRCFTSGCLKRTGKPCNHQACQDYKYTFHDRQMTGKFFCADCHKKPQTGSCQFSHEMNECAPPLLAASEDRILQQFLFPSSTFVWIRKPSKVT